MYGLRLIIKSGYQPREEDMNSVVSIHNTVNEQVWTKIMEWERLRLKEGDPRFFHIILLSHVYMSWLDIFKRCCST